MNNLFIVKNLKRFFDIIALIICLNYLYCFISVCLGFNYLSYPIEIDCITSQDYNSGNSDCLIEEKHYFSGTPDQESLPPISSDEEAALANDILDSYDISRAHQLPSDLEASTGEDPDLHWYLMSLSNAIANGTRYGRRPAYHFERFYNNAPTHVKEAARRLLEYRRLNDALRAVREAREAALARQRGPKRKVPIFGYSQLARLEAKLKKRKRS